MTHIKRHKLLILLLGIFILVVGFFAWLYTGKINPTKEKVLSKLPLPIALVNNRPVLMKEFAVRYDISKKLNAQNPSTDQAALKRNIYDALIKERQIKIIAAAHGVSVSDKELNKEYEVVSQNTALPNNQKFGDFLSAYGLTEQDFKQLLLKPELLSTELMVWFNSQKNLNQESYNTAADIQNKLSSGEKFADLAKSYSQDSTSQAMEGDMGFVQINELLPELKETVDAMQPGETKLLVSRYGLHVTKMEEKNNNGPQNTPQAHLRQIFIKAGNYQQWLGNETKNISVKTLIDPSK